MHLWYNHIISYLEGEKRMDQNTNYPAVSPEGFCPRFDRCSTSLIEEPEYCEVCVFFCDRDATCRWPDRAQD